MKTTMVGYTKKFSLTGTGTKRGPIDKRFIVRGHWRKQPVGKRGGGEYKTIFIEPHVKGQDAGGTLARNYEVK